MRIMRNATRALTKSHTLQSFGANRNIPGQLVEHVLAFAKHFGSLIGRFYASVNAIFQELNNHFARRALRSTRIVSDRAHSGQSTQQFALVAKNSKRWRVTHPIMSPVYTETVHPLLRRIVCSLQILFSKWCTCQHQRAAMKPTKKCTLSQHKIPRVPRK
jgi:hypothetical protein